MIEFSRIANIMCDTFWKAIRDIVLYKQIEEGEWGSERGGGREWENERQRASKKGAIFLGVKFFLHVMKNQFIQSNQHYSYIHTRIAQLNTGGIFTLKKEKKKKRFNIKLCTNSATTHSPHSPHSLTHLHTNCLNVSRWIFLCE